MKNIEFMALFLLVSMNVQSLMAAELKVDFELSPESASKQSTKVNVSSIDVNFEDPSGDVRVYKPKSETELLADGEISLENLPAGYLSNPIKIRLPTQRKKSLSIVMVGLKVNDTPRRITEIYGTNINKPGLSTDDLFKLYQETRYLSIRRLDDIKGPPGRGMYNKDVQIFFKFLEVAREIGRMNFVRVDASADRVKEYLREQNGIPEGQEIIVKALGQNGVKNVDLLLEEIDFVDADQLNSVWEYLKDAEPILNPRKCQLIRSFVSKVESFDERMVNMWSNKENYKFLSLGYTAFEPCSKILGADVAKSNSETSIKELKLIDDMVSKVVEKSYASESIKSSAFEVKQVIAPMYNKF